MVAPVRRMLGYLAVAAACVACFAGAREPPRRWLVTQYRAEGGIDRSWIVTRVERDGCSVSLPEEEIVLVGGPEKLIRIERWR